MGGRTLMFDANAVLILRMSASNPGLDDKSIYKLSKNKGMQRVGKNLRELLNTAINDGYELCVTDTAWIEARNAYDRIIKEKAYKYEEFRRAVWLYHNQEYYDRLRDLTRSCHEVTEEKFLRIKAKVIRFYERWMKDKDVIRCIKKRKHVKNPCPEDQDIHILAEAISNQQASGNDTFLVTGDGHFICYREQIRSEFGILLTNYYKA